MTLIEQYRAKLIQKREEAQAQVAAQALEVQSELQQMGAEIDSNGSISFPSDETSELESTKKLSRRATEFLAYSKMFSQLILPNLITPEQYDEINFEDPTLEERYAVVVTTMEEAQRILEQGPLRRPIFIQNAYPPLLTMESFLNELEVRSEADAQDYDAPVSGEEDEMTERMSGTEVVRLFGLAEKCLNLLNLECVAQNVIPACLASIPAYNVLTTVKEDNSAGKKVVSTLRDLTNCATFHISANANAYSLLHEDSYGKYTSVHDEFGEKPWPTWPRLTASESEEWRNAPNQGYTYFPTLEGMFLYLGPGDLLIMPSNTPHAPYTMTDCLMTGTQHFHSESILEHMRSGIEELRFPNFTNELPAREAPIKFEKLMERWRAGGGNCKYPPRDLLEEGQAQFEVFAL